MADNPEARPEKVPAIPISDTPHAPTPSCMKSNEVRSEGIEKMKPVLENIETGNRPARI